LAARRGHEAAAAAASRPGTIHNGDLLLWGGAYCGRLLSDLRFTLLIHAPRPRGRPGWACPGAGTARCAGGVLQEI